MPAKKATADTKKKATKKVAKKAPAKKANGKTAVTKSAASQSTTAKKATAKKSNGKTIRNTINAPALVALSVSVEHESRVAETAYYLAERRGFQPGRELEDWLQAEEFVESLVHKHA